MAWRPMSTNSFFGVFFAQSVWGYLLNARMGFITCAFCFWLAARANETCAHIHARVASNDRTRLISQLTTLLRDNPQRDLVL